jgi:hypothetical protein
MPAGWSRVEVEATVASYFAMLHEELSGKRYNKAEYRRKLAPLLDNRSEQSIEFKFANISAVLIELQFPYVPGYKPRSNYQGLLFDVVAARLEESPEIHRVATSDTEKAVVAIPTVDDILAALTDPPKPVELKNRAAMPRTRYSAHPINYLEREANNHSLGLAGEEFAINFERARLIKAGREGLASKIEHVSKSKGDGEGYDVLSFEESGSPRLIEVKTTKYGVYTPFFVSRNELEVSKVEANSYCLYRVFDFRAKPLLFTLRGALSSTCDLDPSSYVARVS